MTDEALPLLSSEEAKTPKRVLKLQKQKDVRWNSYYIMMERMVCLRKAVDKYVHWAVESELYKSANIW